MASTLKSQDKLVRSWLTWKIQSSFYQNGYQELYLPFQITSDSQQIALYASSCYGLEMVFFSSKKFMCLNLGSKYQENCKRQ